VNAVTRLVAAGAYGTLFVTARCRVVPHRDSCVRAAGVGVVAPSVELATNTNNRGTEVLLEQQTGIARQTSSGSEVTAFVRRAFGIRFQMRFHWETKWWPVDAQEVAETLAGYHNNLQGCLEQMREGQELRSGLAHFRVRR
jgi:hypothetical protein